MITDPDAEAAGLPEGLRFFHPDHLGSINVVTDASGKVLESTTHQPFGAVHHRDVAPGHSATGSLRHSFTGQREDVASGLVLFPARPYDPELGRFLQPDPFVQDPADPQSLNRYSYVRNNPVNFVDPSGYRKKKHHGFWKAIVAIVFAVVAVVNIVAGGVALAFGQPELAAASFRAAAWDLQQSATWYAAYRADNRAAPASSEGSPRGPPSGGGPAEAGGSPSGSPEASAASAPSTPPAARPWWQPLVRPALDLAQALAHWDRRTAAVVGTTEVRVTTASVTHTSENFFFRIDNSLTEGTITNPGAQPVRVEFERGSPPTFSLTSPLGPLTVSSSGIISTTSLLGGNTAFIQFVPLTFGLARTQIAGNTFQTNRLGFQLRPQGAAVILGLSAITVGVLFGPQLGFAVASSGG